MKQEMAKWNRWVFKRAPVKKKYKPFNKTIKNANQLKPMLQNTTFKKVVTKIFSKNTFKAAAAVGGVTVVGLAIDYINDYIQSNSGCFIKTKQSICKLESLSCCQPDPVENVSFCSFNVQYPDPCDNFNEDVENSCCKFCDCRYHDCLPSQTMECRRPTVGEALTHFSSGLTSSIWSILNQIFPWFAWILGIGATIVVIWLALLIYKKIRK